MDATLEQLYDRLMSNVNSVLEVFNNYYGEERVDLQGFLTKEQFLTQGVLERDDTYNSAIIHSRGVIMVHFPQVTVTNENDKSIDITQLWVKVGINLEGTITGRFTMNRSEYTMTQILANYSHSHLSEIPFSEPHYFSTPCTGSGPINNTIAGLAAQCDLDFWGLFCYELDLYTKTESIAGTPYRYLERVGVRSNEEKQAEYTILRDLKLHTDQSNSRIPSSFRGIMIDFLDYFIKKKRLTFTFNIEEYSLGMSFLDFRILLSNSFIEWYNREDNPYRRNTVFSLSRLINNNLISRCVVEGPRVFRIVNTESRNYGRWHTKDELMDNFNNKLVCVFKGINIYTNIVDDEEEEETNSNIVYLLNQNMCGNIAYHLLKTINYKIAKYGITNSSTTRSTPESIATCRKLRFI